MATFSHPRLPARSVRTVRTARKAVSSRPVTAFDATDEPRRAASVVPVLLAFGVLVLLSVAAAYLGREVISLVGSFLSAP